MTDQKQPQENTKNEQQQPTQEEVAAATTTTAASSVVDDGVVRMGEIVSGDEDIQIERDVAKWMKDMLNREVKKLKDQGARCTQLTVKNTGILIQEENKILNRVEVDTAFDFDEVISILISDSTECPVKKGYSYINVILITKKPTPMILPYIYLKSDVNKLTDWVFINNQFGRSQHKIEEYSEVKAETTTTIPNWFNYLIMLKYLLSIIVFIIIISSLVVSTTSFKLDAQYYVVRPDLRLCSKPMCGGFILQRLNGEPGERGIYVAELLFDTPTTRPRVNPSTVTQLIQDDPLSVIVRGFFQKNQHNNLYNDLFVLNYYKSLPPPDSTYSQFAVDQATHSRYFRVNPCKQQEGSVGSDEEDPITTCTFTEVHYNTAHENIVYKDPFNQGFALFDHKWYKSRLNDVKDIHTSTIIEALQDGTNITILRSFVHLPDPREECPALTRTKCESGEVSTYTRDENRCYVFNKCTRQGPCPLYVPHCPRRYVTVSFASTPNACPAWICDAEFLDDTNPFKPFPLR
ncbi:hypothetical protein DFA_00962 [Cavenderia fasciculata]|uniref:Uncharacterized protein n=1 Tax=Cavenderia fasciculata TaxID=261658 RepID=F4PUR8_CACFS|nr:uncharacterized protein DFA_00962 [Cavenderia fasciculata]EGG21087.1 hypothetical protein DFA_00962 [Cavenderia fasciculata]|eukprot:XP_004358937.1 hypothetical protein DFA_00962 [Cavenderia fasciculata]